VRFFVGRIVRSLLIVLVGTFAIYSLMRMISGENDPARQILGFQATEENVKALRAELGLDRNVFVGYVNWLGDVVQGDLGQNYKNNIPVWEEMKAKLPRSLLLMLYSQLIGIIIAVPLGIYSAYRYNRTFDKAASTATFGVTALPNFIMGLLFVFVLANSRDSFFKATGYAPISEGLGPHFKTMFLPAMTLGIGLAAVYSRLLRADMIQTLQDDFITMARSKGITSRRILFRHALRPSLFSLVTSAGIQIGALIGGAVAVEQIFDFDGIGSFIAGSVLEREYLKIQGGFLVVILLFVLSNLLVEVIYGLLDPRVRHARAVS
jgi:peptide/nickel transport system permease protein